MWLASNRVSSSFYCRNPSLQHLLNSTLILAGKNIAIFLEVVAWGISRGSNDDHGNRGRRWVPPALRYRQCDTLKNTQCVRCRVSDPLALRFLQAGWVAWQWPLSPSSILTE